VAAFSVFLPLSAFSRCLYWALAVFSSCLRAFSPRSSSSLRSLSFSFCSSVRRQHRTWLCGRYGIRTFDRLVNLLDFPVAGSFPFDLSLPGLFFHFCCRPPLPLLICLFVYVVYDGLHSLRRNLVDGLPIQIQSSTDVYLAKVAVLACLAPSLGRSMCLQLPFVQQRRRGLTRRGVHPLVHLLQLRLYVPLCCGKYGLSVPSPLLLVYLRESG